MNPAPDCLELARYGAAAGAGQSSRLLPKSGTVAALKAGLASG